MAFLLGFINPSSFNFILSIYFLAFVIVGGLGSIFGSVMGGIVMTWLMLVLDKVQEMPYVGQALDCLFREVDERCRASQHRQHHLRADHHSAGGVRTPGALRLLDPDQDLLEDVAVLRRCDGNTGMMEMVGIKQDSIALNPVSFLIRSSSSSFPTGRRPNSIGPWLRSEP